MDPNAFYVNDFRNRIVDQLLLGVMPIIRIHNATMIDPYAHIQEEFFRSYFAMDCTHFCMPSNPMYMVRDIFHNVFNVLLKKDDALIAQLKND